MAKVVKNLKKLLKVSLWVALAVLIVYLLLSNRSLRKADEKNQNIIKGYEKEFFGSEEESKEESPKAEGEEIVEGIEYSTEEIQMIIQKLYSIEKRIEALEKGQQNSTTTVKSETATETVKESNAKESVESYLSRKFPFNGNYYKEAGDTQYYSDTFCTQKLNSESLRFMSQTTDYTSAENGLSVICVLTDDWKIVYCTQSPYLITEAEYEEIHYQK